MLPFLAIFTGCPGESLPELLNCLEKETPVDFLFIDSSNTNEFTYRYATSQNIFREALEIIGDYTNVLLMDEKTQKIFKTTCSEITDDEKNSLWFVDGQSKKIFCNDEKNRELMRYFSIKGFQVFIKESPQYFKGLTLAEFTLITKLICLNNSDSLDTLLRREALLCFPNKPKSLAFYSNIQNQVTPQTEGIIEVSEKATSDNSTPKLPVFNLLQPSLHLWVYSKAFATAGSIDYDLKKLLKETHRRIEEVKYCSFSPAACLNDHIFSFMDNFETDNELELAFSFDTIRLEIEEFAKTKGLNLLSERSSKTSRVILLSAEKRE